MDMEADVGEVRDWASAADTTMAEGAEHRQCRAKLHA